jgi:hypothetical protein
LGLGAIKTGHWSMHAPQVVHAQSVSSAIVPPNNGRAPSLAAVAVATSSGASHEGWKWPGRSCNAPGW